jgi:hypothetical protein
MYVPPPVIPPQRQSQQILKLFSRGYNVISK